MLFVDMVDRTRYSPEIEKHIGYKRRLGFVSKYPSEKILSEYNTETIRKEFASLENRNAVAILCQLFFFLYRAIQNRGRLLP